jgi:ribulose-phosphate 3-epimerase
MRLKIAPSILAAAFERLGDEVQQVEAAGADQIHIDVMDGHFVPNLSMGPVVVEALRRATRLPLDVHLMITDPSAHVDSFIRAGASHISFHVEAEDDPPRLAARLHERGVGAGLALNPETPVERVLDLLPHFEMVLVMTVHPGFGGQSFLPENLEKVAAVRERAGRGAARPLDIQVDGGIDLETAPAALAAGSNVFVAGSAIFAGGKPGAAVRALRERLTGAAAVAGKPGA